MNASSGYSGIPAINLPPPFRLVMLAADADPLAHALSLARDGSGMLVLAERPAALACALVLEPEAPLAAARRVHYAGMLALAETLAGPGSAVTVEWPGTLNVNGAPVGKGRLAWPDAAAEDMVPDWLVFGAQADLGHDDASGRAAEVFARRFLAALNLWYENGFAALADAYALRFPAFAGAERAIDCGGNLVVLREGGEERFSLRQALAMTD